jgi:hypothetical protein
MRRAQKLGKGTSAPEGAILAYMTPDDLQTLPEMKEMFGGNSRTFFSIRSHRPMSDSLPVNIGVGKSVNICFA